MSSYKRRLGLVVVAVVLATVVAGCADDVDDTATGAAADVTEERSADDLATRVHSGRNLAAASAPQSAGGSDAMADEGGGVGTTITEAPAVGPSVIKTADVTVEVDRYSLADAVRGTISAAGRFGGFVFSTAMQDAKQGTATVIVRVPAENFERALAELEGLGKVESEVVSGRDVGQEFVDLEARIRNLESQEAVLLRLMERSQTVGDTIRVQRELQGVQLEIERLTGRVRYLREQTDMSTISMSFFESGVVPGDDVPGMLEKAWERAVSLALGVVAALIVATGVLIPLMLLAAVAYLLFRALRPRFTS